MKGSGLAIARTPGGEIVLIRTGDGGRNRGRTSQPSYTRGIHSAGSWQQPIDDEHARQRRLYALSLRWSRYRTAGVPGTIRAFTRT